MVGSKKKRITDLNDLGIIAFRFIGIGIQIFKGKISSIGAGGKVELTQIEEDK